MAEPAPFVFSDDPAAAGTDAVLLQVPSGLADKEALLACYGESLRFPSHFGGNWDALSDCLRDLSWLAEKPIRIAHTDLPLTGEDQGMYLDILADAVDHWRVDAARDFTVVFPPRLKSEIDGRVVRRRLSNQ